MGARRRHLTPRPCSEWTGRGGQRSAEAPHTFEPCDKQGNQVCLLQEVHAGRWMRRQPCLLYLACFAMTCHAIFAGCSCAGGRSLLAREDSCSSHPANISCHSATPHRSSRSSVLACFADCVVAWQGVPAAVLLAVWASMLGCGVDSGPAGRASSSEGEGDDAAAPGA